MGWSMKGEWKKSLKGDNFWKQHQNPNSPRYKRSAPTKRQKAVNRRRWHSCHCPDMWQIGGGQCGFCGKFTRHEKYGRTNVRVR